MSLRFFLKDSFGAFLGLIGQAKDWTGNGRDSRSSRYQTLIKHSTVHRQQVEYDDSLLRRI